MKIMHKVSGLLFLPTALLLLLGGVTALFFIFDWTIPGIGRTLADPDCRQFTIDILLVAVVLWIGSCLLAVWFLFRRLRKHLLEAGGFTARMSSGEFPEPLILGTLHGDEVRSLYSSLNCLRDRLCNLSGKLKTGLQREVNLRHEIERYDTLQLHLLSRCLPDCRRTLGLVKSYAMAAQLREEGKPDPDVAFLADMKALRLRLNVFSMEIEQLFDLSRLERDRWQHPEETDFPAGEFMRDLVDRCTIPLRSRGVNLETGYFGGAQGLLHGDRELLFRLLNVLIRALGRSAGNGGTITFTRGMEGDRVFFELRDTRNVPCRQELAEEFLKITRDNPERFAYPEDAGVSALALGIVRDVASGLGCELQVSSDENSWSCLRFLLPANGIGRSLSAVPADSLRTSAPIQDGDGNADGSHANGEETVRVLLLDEDQEEAEVYSRVLRAYGIQCTLAASLQELTEKFYSATCDAVILMEPDQDPDEFPAKLRRISGKRNLPVVVIASQFSEEDFRRFLNHGRVWCLNMPLKFQLLCDILHKAVGK